MTLPTYENVILHEYRAGTFAEVTLPVSAEYAMLLKINGSPYITIACSGNSLREHITGYLLTEGIISTAHQIERMEIDESAMVVDAHLHHDKSIVERLKKIQKITRPEGGQKTSAA